MAKRINKFGTKRVSHGTHRYKRHPTSPKCRKL